MKCRYCHREIEWREGQGWLQLHFGTVQYGTHECPERGNPALGHALPEPVDGEL